MYILDSLAEGVLVNCLTTKGMACLWPTLAHKKVFLNICTCNQRVVNAGQLFDNYKIIKEISKEDIEKVTSDDLRELGCDF